jgi:hypothetical protein
MTSYNMRVLQMVARVLIFRADQADKITRAPQAGPLFDHIEQLCQTISTLHKSQMLGGNGVRSSSRQRNDARAALRGELEGVCRTALSIGLQGFFMPRARNDATMLNVAQVYADAAAAHVQEFIQCGMPEDFLARLRTSADELRVQMQTQESGKRLRNTATSEIALAQAEILQLLTRLDPMMENLFRESPALRSAWYTVRRVHKAATKKAVEPAAPLETQALAARA